MISKFITCVCIFFITMVSVCRAFLANRCGNNKWIPLPHVDRSINKSFTMEQLVAIVDRIVRAVILNTAHPCLYYSYARCRVLRSCGYFIQLNIGLHNLQAGQQADGHCWLSRKGQVLFEETNPHKMYPDMMGERGDVIYWAMLKKVEGKEFVRKRKKS